MGIGCGDPDACACPSPGHGAGGWDHPGLTSTWTPQIGSEFGLRIHRRLREGWTLGGGIEWVRREHTVVSAYANDTLGIATADTLPQLRSLAYRLPVLGGIRIPLGWNGTELQASGGVALEWKTSETIASMLVQTAEDDRVCRRIKAARVL